MAGPGFGPGGGPLWVLVGGVLGRGAGLGVGDGPIGRELRHGGASLVLSRQHPLMLHLSLMIFLSRFSMSSSLLPLPATVFTLT